MRRILNHRLRPWQHTRCHGCRHDKFKKMEKKKKKKLFDLVLSVSESGAQLTCTKDGQNMMPEAMTGTNVSYALEALRYATGLFARLYVVQLHKEGKITDEQYQKFREETGG